MISLEFGQIWQTGELLKIVCRDEIQNADILVNVPLAWQEQLLLWCLGG